VAFFLRHLRKYYDHKIGFEEIDDVLFKLSVGCRAFPDRSKDSRFPEAFNVLTLINGADKVFVEMGGEKETNPFRSSYDRLSEFCHPNTLGLTIASDIIKSGGEKTVWVGPRQPFDIADEVPIKDTFFCLKTALLNLKLCF